MLRSKPIKIYLYESSEFNLLDQFIKFISQILLLLFFFLIVLLLIFGCEESKLKYRIMVSVGNRPEFFHIDNYPIKEGNCIKFDNTEICGTYTIIKLR